MALIEAAVGAIARMGVAQAASKAKRNETVVKILKRLSLDAGLPNDFEGLYVYALVEYGVDRPPDLVSFFSDDALRDAYKASWESGDYARLERAALDRFELYEEQGRLRVIDLDPRREIPMFQRMFEELVAKTRSAAESAQHRVAIQTHDEIQQLKADVALIRSAVSQPQLIETRELEEVVRQVLESKGRSLTIEANQVGRLADEAALCILLHVMPDDMGPEYLLAAARSTYSDPVLIDEERGREALEKAELILNRVIAQMEADEKEKASVQSPVDLLPLPRFGRNEIHQILSESMLPFEDYRKALESVDPSIAAMKIVTGYQHASVTLGDWVAYKYLELLLQLKFYDALRPILRERIIALETEVVYPQALEATWDLAADALGPDDFIAWRKDVTHAIEKRRKKRAD